MGMMIMMTRIMISWLGGSPNEDGMKDDNITLFCNQVLVGITKQIHNIFDSSFFREGL